VTVTFFLQVDLQPVADRIDRLSPPTDIFRAVAENAVQLSSSERASDDLLDELCCNESLAGVSLCLYTLVFELLIRSLLLFSCLIVLFVHNHIKNLISFLYRNIWRCCDLM
jgi:hypothetical protein